MTAIMSDFQFAKDTAEPVFFSKQTETKFILYAHLEGYKRKNFEIKISEDGRELAVSGEKPLKMKEEEQEVKTKEFKKVFKIPQGVVLDGIKASYHEDQWMLKIVMPKMVKGSGAGIEEEEEEEAESSEVDQKVKKEEVDEEPEEEVTKENEEEETSQEMKKQRPRKPRKPCFPLLCGGSTLLLSLVFIVIHFIRSKHK